MNFDEMQHILKETEELLIKKNKMYGDGNIDEIGEEGVIIRIKEKVERLKHLLSIKEDPPEETIEDNWKDIIGYGIIGLMEKSVGLKEYKVNKPEKDYRVIIDSSVKDVRPYTACAIVRGLSLDDEKIKELIEIQEKLHITIGRKRKKMAIGIYPLEKIKLPITFKAIEPDKIKFMPLESDKELSGLEILHKHPAGKEYAHLLAGKVKFPVFVDANNEIGRAHV